MLLIKLVTLTLVLFLASQSQGVELEDVPLLAKTLKDLHSGPPKQKLKQRAISKENWITQPLDHFDDSNKETFKMRYLVNDEFQAEGSPIFILFGGEWEIEPTIINMGHWYDLAKEHKGVLVYTEYRYYGKSVPTENLSLDNLQYLHVKQALADLANFIRTFKTENPQLSNSKVVISGCSYSASMVVWFKRLYPDLVEGGWASSSLLFAKVDFFEYKEIAGAAFKQLGGQKCYDHIEKGIAQLENLFAEKRYAEASSLMRLCSNFDHENDLDVWSLFSSLSNVFGLIAQRNQPGQIPLICRDLLSTDDPLVAIANFFYSAWASPSCINASYQSTVDYYTADPGDSARPWYYQLCNEYGWFPSSRSNNQPFGNNFPATLYIELCKDVFSRKFGNSQLEANVAKTNEEFGGLSPNVKNIYMTFGALDPWSPIGRDTECATVIAEASHCADMFPVRDSDSPELRAAKERLATLLREWLA